MKHQRQGDAECFLASVAMLADKPLEEVRIRAGEITGLPWLQVASSPVHFWPMSVSLCETYKLKNLAQVCRELNEFRTMALLHHSDYTRLERFRLEIETKLQGKGQMGLYWFWLGPNRGHSVVFENKKIYDPNAPESLEFLDWLRFVASAYGGVPSHVIITEEMEEMKDEKNNDNLRV